MLNSRRLQILPNRFVNSRAYETTIAPRIMTCTSTQSRNLRFGLALGAGAGFDAGVTVEGSATALAVVQMAARLEIDMPVTKMVAALIGKKLPLDEAIRRLMSRPLKQE